MQIAPPLLCAHAEPDRTNLYGVTTSVVGAPGVAESVGLTETGSLPGCDQLAGKNGPLDNIFYHNIDLKVFLV